MKEHFKINRMEFSGSLGDLGTILPLALAMILINGMDPSAVFFCFGLYYIISGFYFKVTMPVEPMKVIAAYAIAANITAAQIQSSSLLLALLLLLLGGTDLIHFIGKNIPLAVIRGVQLSTGILLIKKGIELAVGISPYQRIHGANEPALVLQNIGGLPIGIIIGTVLFFLTLFLLDNKKIPAAVVVVTLGFIIGIALHAPSAGDSFDLQLSLPPFLPYGLPNIEELSFAFLVLVLPQVPMTIGNAIIANADLSARYFPDTGKQVTGKSLCLSMGFANLFVFFLGGIPMCHGAGGLASRYRFGARTAGSNLIIGAIFIILVLAFGGNILTILNYMPMAALGVLLIFAGVQLSLTLLDMRSRQDMFVIVIMLAMTLTTNLAIGFIVGILLAYLVRIPRLSI